MQFADLYGLGTVALRYFNVFGPRQDQTSDYAAVIPKFISLMLDSRRPPIYGDGEQSRDFTYVANVVQANLEAATSQVSGAVLNIACGERTTVNALVDQLNAIMGTNLEPRYTDPRPGDIKHSLADISQANELIGYSPKVNFDVGLERTVEWFEPRSGSEVVES